jgi:zinc/manganese transport system permease protein
MSAFLIEPFAQYGFMRLSLAACLVLALGNGPLGVMLLLRRMAPVAEVLGHAIVPGAAIGYVIAGYSLFALSIGGVLSGLVVAALAGLSARNAARETPNLIAFYLISVALGVLLVSRYGSNRDLMSVLFGSVLAADPASLVFMAAITTANWLLLAWLYRPLAVQSFDPGFLRAAKAGGPIFSAIFLAMVVGNLIVGFQALGTLLAVGPLLLPAAAARLMVRSLAGMMALATFIGLLAAYAGLLLSYHAGWPSGPAIVLVSGGLYGVAHVVARWQQVRSAVQPA